MDEPDINHIKNFFNMWSTYDKLIHYNYMAHNEIYAELKKFFVETLNGEYDILDLGCGDCSHISAIIDDSRIKSYIGVDISPVALGDARKELENILSKVTLIEGDFTDYIGSCENDRFDIVITGYSIHHLYYNNKQSFFDNCYRVLKSGGYLVHYDVLRLESETRDQYLNRYFEIIDSWDNLEPEEISSVKEHIAQSDFPSSQEEISSMVVNSYFTLVPGMLYTDEHRIHTLSCFIKR